MVQAMGAAKWQILATERMKIPIEEQYAMVEAGKPWYIRYKWPLVIGGIGFGAVLVYAIVK